MDANDVCYSFGGNTAEVIYNFICETVNDFEYITLNKGLTVISVSFFVSDSDSNILMKL